MFDCTPLRSVSTYLKKIILLHILKIFQSVIFFLDNLSFQVIVQEEINFFFFNAFYLLRFFLFFY